MTRLSQRDARSRNMVKSLGYCIKHTDFILQWVCTLITYRGRQNVVGTSITLRAALLCNYQVLTLSVRCHSTGTRQNEIYLLNTIPHHTTPHHTTLYPYIDIKQSKIYIKHVTFFTLLSSKAVITQTEEIIPSVTAISSARTIDIFALIY